MSGQRAQQEAEVRRHSPARGLCCDVDSDSVFPQWDLWDLSALQTQSHSIGAAGNRSISSGCNETADADVQNPSSFFSVEGLLTDGFINSLRKQGTLSLGEETWQKTTTDYWFPLPTLLRISFHFFNSVICLTPI